MMIAQGKSLAGVWDNEEDEESPATVHDPKALDTRNVLDPADARTAGFTYSGTGR